MRTQDLGLLLLALLTAGLAWFAVEQVAHTAAPAPTGTLETAGPEVADSSLPDGAAASSAMVPPGAQPDDAAVTSVPARRAPASLVPARHALAGVDADSVTLTVLGDSTGDQDGEWVHLWATALSADRPVALADWDQAGEQGYGPTTDLATSGRRTPLVLWNGSRSGATATYPVERIAAMVPRGTGLVLLSFGHNDERDAVAGELDRLLAAVRTRVDASVPVVVLLQQPERGDANADVRAAVKAWASAHQLPTIDVATAFTRTGDPEALLADDLHPNEAGSRLWAQVVENALAPRS